ncbi:MAG: hypothetical protein AAFP13_15365 [Pseudomonadota bacterium]
MGRFDTMIRVTYLALAVAASTLPSTTNSQELVNGLRESALAPLSDPIGHAMLEYTLAKIPAFYIFQPRGEAVGDFYKLNDLDVAPRWQECSSEVISDGFDTTFEDREHKFVVDLGAVLELKGEAGLWSFGSRSEISVKITTHSDISFTDVGRLDVIDKSAFTSAIGAYAGDNADCLEVKNIMNSIGSWYYSGATYIPIQELFFGVGTVTSYHELSVSGNLSASAELKLSEFLEKLGVGVSVEAAASGGVDSSSRVSRDFAISVPFAFIPYFVSDADYDFVTQLLVNGRLGGRIDESLYDTGEIIELLQQNPKLRDRVFSISNPLNLDPESPESERRFIEISRDGDADYIRARNQLLLIRAHLGELGIGPDDFSQ